MRANRGQLDKALKAPAQSRYFLFYGADIEGSRALAKTMASALGADAERVELSGAELRQDPARLADEAASISMFGGARHILVEPVGDEAIAALEALSAAPVAGNPVALIAGDLRATSRLLKLVLADAAGLAFESRPIEGRDAAALTVAMARALGLTVQSDVAEAIVEASAGNRGVIQRELEKFALFLDAAPERPRPLMRDAFDAVAAANEEGDFRRLTDAIGRGDGRLLQIELDRLTSEGIEGIPLIRAALRSAIGVMASRGGGMFARWPADLKARAIERLCEAEREVKASGSLGPIAADEALFAICRQSSRLG